MRIGYHTWVVDRGSSGIPIYASHVIENIKNLPGTDIFAYHYTKNTSPVYNGITERIIPINNRPHEKLIDINHKIREDRLDIFHVMSSNYNEIPVLFGTPSIKKVATIYDLTTLLYANTHKWAWARVSNAVLRFTGAKADRIIAISENTKKDCVKHLKISEDKIDVIPLAVDTSFQILNDKTAAREHIHTKFGISNPFILSVSTLEKRKNIPTLIQAFAHVKKSNPDHILVIAGAKGWKYDDIFRTVTELNIANSVLFLDHVTLQELIYLYNLAECLVYPSLYEGFGLPPLEALSCGCPVITSNNSSLPEVVGDAGILIEPTNVPRLVKAINQVITNDELRDSMILNGLLQAQKFTYEKVARQTYEVYEGLVNE